AVLAIQYVLAFDRDAHAVDDLIRHRWRIAQGAHRGFDLQRPFVIHRKPGDTVVCQPDVRDARAGAHAELVLQRALVLAKTHVDAGPYMAIGSLCVTRDAGEPRCGIFPLEVVDVSRRAFLAFERDAGTASWKTQRKRDPLVRFLV